MVSGIKKTGTWGSGIIWSGVIRSLEKTISVFDRIIIMSGLQGRPIGELQII